MDAHSIARLHLVTRRFVDLQGLRTIVLAAACIAAFWSQPYISALRHAGPLEAILGLGLSFLPFAAALSSRMLDRYYRRRFGSVSAGPLQRARDIGPPIVLLLGAFWVDMIKLGTGSPSAVLIAGAVLSLHTAVRDWPWRGHHLIAAAGCAIGAGLSALVPGMRADNLLELVRLPVSWLLAVHVLPAWLDHRLLITTMREHGPVADAEPALRTLKPAQPAEEPQRADSI